jgi:hypothetical protein
MLPAHLQLYGILVGFLLALIGTGAAAYRSRDPRLVYVLPLLHLLICVVVWVGDWAWLPVFVIEFPVGIFLLVLSWRYDPPPLLLCGVLGTLWWYFVSRLLFSFLRARD